MSAEWTTGARDELIRRRDRNGVWGYRSGLQPSVEATVLASLGLAGCFGADQPAVSEALRRGSDWLASMQHADGSLGVTAALPSPNWPTAHALWLWSALGSHHDRRDRAAAWLLSQKGEPIANHDPQAAGVVGHDTTLIGWPWIDGTHSWLEPTSLAIVALGRHGLHDHPRIIEGIQLLNDRSLRDGGWNYGNRAAFGRPLRPQPGPTGLALLALASVPQAKASRAVAPAIAYLRTVLPDLRAPVSLGWGVLGLRAWQACPNEAESWLERSYTTHGSRPDATAGLGLLLLAGRDRGSLLKPTDSTGARPS